MNNIPDINEILRQAIALNASDLHITTDSPPVVRLDGRLELLDYPALGNEDTQNIADQILSAHEKGILATLGEVDLSYSIPEAGFFRVNVFKQRSAVSIAFRIISNVIPSIDSLHLPAVVKTLARQQRGLIIVTGPTGCGKSTTLAAMTDLINQEKFCHILTLEDPIEYLHEQKKSIVNQREIGRDSKSFPAALRAALRQDPDVILVGEMRDLETISIALTAAETGHLILTSLHTMDAPKTVDRIIDVFPANQQEQIRVQLATSLVGVISQRLLPCLEGSGRLPAVEVLINTPAVKNLIREKKIHQIYSFMQAGAKYGMQTLDNDLLSLVGSGAIGVDDALENAADKDTLQQYLKEEMHLGKRGRGH